MGSTTAMADAGDDLSNDFYQGPNQGLNVPSRPRYPGVYVGNLTWWTTDEDVTNAIQIIGVNDIQEVKFFENRNNGQSKGFCVVTFQSEHSLQIVMDKLPKLELYGQNPMVAHYNRQNLSLFETQPKVRTPLNASNGPNSHGPGMAGINSTTGVHAPGTQGIPYPPSNTFNPGMGMAGLRNPGGFHGNMRMGMRAPKLDLYGQNSIGGPYRQNMNMFDPQSKMRPQLNSNGPHGGGMMGINPIGGSHMNDGGGGGGPAGQSYQPMSSGGYNHSSGGGPGMGRNPSFNPNIRGHPNMRGGIAHRPSIRRDEDYPPSSSRRLEEHSSSRRDEEQSSSSRQRDDKTSSSSRRDEKSSSSSSRHRDDKTSSSSSRRERGSHRDERVRSRSRERSSERHHRSHRSRERSTERTRDRSRERRDRREKRDSRH